MGSFRCPNTRVLMLPYANGCCACYRSWQAFYDKSTERVWNLRHDSLAVMLSLANVTAGAKVRVLRRCSTIAEVNKAGLKVRIVVRRRGCFRGCSGCHARSVLSGGLHGSELQGRRVWGGTRQCSVSVSKSSCARPYLRRHDSRGPARGSFCGLRGASAGFPFSPAVSCHTEHYTLIGY